MGLLDGKQFIVTGGANGIGASCVEKFAQEGAALIVIVDIDMHEAQRHCQDVQDRFGTKCIPQQADISVTDNISTVFENYKKYSQRLDVLLNAAGIAKIVDVNDITPAEWDKTMNVNLRAPFFFAREALKIMKTQRYGRIINMASQAGKSGGIMVGMDYAASKGGLLNLTKSLAKYAAPFNVTVNSIAPGLVSTGMTTDFGYDPKTVPLGRIGVPAEVADATAFLASDLSRYMTGACLDVNGGISMW